MQKIFIIFFLISSISAKVEKEDIEQAIKEIDIEKIEFYKNNKLIKLNKSEREYYLTLAQKIIRENYLQLQNQSYLNFNTARRSLLALSTLTLGVSGTAIMAFLAHKTSGALSMLMLPSEILLTSYGVNQLYKVISHFDQHQNYNNARLVFHAIKEIPTE